MFFQQLDWFSFSDRVFFLVAYMLPMTVMVFGLALFVEYKRETRKK